MDLKASQAFYEDVLRLGPRHRQASGFVQFWTGSVDLCIESTETYAPPVLIFTVDNLAELHAQLRTAALRIEGPIQGGRRPYIVVYDPDGNALIFEEEAEEDDSPE
jgi:catechol 2,3-dioxygenase-like lactoylglutathione lyase family enzyme